MWLQTSEFSDYNSLSSSVDIKINLNFFFNKNKNSKKKSFILNICAYSRDYINQKKKTSDCKLNLKESSLTFNFCKKMKIICILLTIYTLLSYSSCKPLLDFCSIDDDECELDKEFFTTPSYTKLPNFCEFCDIAMPVFRSLIDNNKTEHFETIAIIFCDLFNIVDPVVCSSAIKEYELAVLSVIRDTPLSDQELCNYGLGCGPVNSNPIFNWTIPLPNVPKPSIIPPKPPQPGSPTLRILHLSDLHIDFEYQPGAPADCLDPLCCRNQSTPNPKSNSTGAGYWGDYRNCDVPFWTAESMFEYIANNEKVEEKCLKLISIDSNFSC